MPSWTVLDLLKENDAYGEVFLQGLNINNCKPELKACGQFKKMISTDNYHQFLILIFLLCQIIADIFIDTLILSEETFPY